MYRVGRTIATAALLSAAFRLAACSGTQPVGIERGQSSALPAQRTPATAGYATLYSFSGGNADGALPLAPLHDVQGTLYGTTASGGGSGCGGSGCGTVFSIATSGVETMLHAFGGSGDGANPVAGLIDHIGTLYGTTASGGAKNAGTVFAITTSGNERVLHSFGSKGDGKNPQAGLLDIKGILYATTEFGGSYNDGTAFSIRPNGAERVLYQFKGPGDAADPSAPFLKVNGTLYSTSETGGIGKGTVFTLTTTGAESVLHRFQFGSRRDGAHPAAALININGTLYGTTFYGGDKAKQGTVFSITTAGLETVLHRFIGGPYDGDYPNAGLVELNGTLYGTTEFGGTSGYGTIFSITKSGKETVLHSFTGNPDGANPQAALINVNGTLYGTTQYGGTNNAGTVFTIAP
jgi:uncharacterized repeat protein (TIGR03803 family)